MANGKGKKNMAKNQAAAVAEKEETAELVAEPARGSTNQNGYRTLNVGVGKRHQERFEGLGKLAEKLGCKDSDLVWLAIQSLIDNPPTEAPEWARSSSGNSSGFWTVPTRDKSGAVTGMKVVECARRGDVQGGRQFCRYAILKDKEGVLELSKNATARKRARKQAQRSAVHDLQFLGKTVAVDEIEIVALAKEATT